MINPTPKERALAHLRAMLGEQADFRPGQWEAINSLLNGHHTLTSVSFLKSLRSQKISMLAVDEAHCISEWGHDFRPDYLHIAQARAAFGNPLTAALTATATPQVQNDIIRLLGMGDSSARIVTGFNRPNLFLNVR